MNSKNAKWLVSWLVILGLLAIGSPAEAKSPRGWGWATQKFKRAALQDPKTPKFIRNGLKEQILRHHRKGKTGFPYLKSPQGYDIGHHPMKRGSIKLKDLRWETSHDNRSRPGRAIWRAIKNGKPKPKYF
jgi:hypothetical protein